MNNIWNNNSNRTNNKGYQHTSDEKKEINKVRKKREKKGQTHGSKTICFQHLRAKLQNCNL